MPRAIFGDNSFNHSTLLCFCSSRCISFMKERHNAHCLRLNLELHAKNGNSSLDNYSSDPLDYSSRNPPRRPRAPLRVKMKCLLLLLRNRLNRNLTEGNNFTTRCIIFQTDLCTAGHFRDRGLDFEVYWLFKEQRSSVCLSPSQIGQFLCVF